MLQRLQLRSTYHTQASKCAIAFIWRYAWMKKKCKDLQRFWTQSLTLTKQFHEMKKMTVFHRTWPTGRVFDSPFKALQLQKCQRTPLLLLCAWFRTCEANLIKRILCFFQYITELLKENQSLEVFIGMQFLLVLMRCLNIHYPVDFVGTYFFAVLQFEFI